MRGLVGGLRLVRRVSRRWEGGDGRVFPNKGVISVVFFLFLFLGGMALAGLGWLVVPASWFECIIIIIVVISSIF
jgi:hypothetical protein